MGAMIDGFAAYLLGRHVACRALHHAGIGPHSLSLSAKISYLGA